MATRREYELLVVHTLDRLARNLKIQRHVLETLGKADVGFASVVEGIDYTTPTGKLVMSVMGSVHEFFSDQLAVQVSEAARQRAEQGMPAGPTPFGYIQLEPGGVPVVDAAKAEALREAFSRRSHGQSYSAAAERFNGLGIPTKEGNRFTAHAMKDIFNCRFYVGVVTYKGTEYPGQHEAIITEELFQAVQGRRHGSPGPRKTWGPSGTLQGMIVCGNCGSPLQSDRSRFGAPMYRERHSRECATNGHSAMAESFDEQIGKIITSIELPDSWRDRMAELALSEYSGPSVADLRDKLRKLGVAYVETDMADSQFKRRKAELEAQIKEANSVVPPSMEAAVELFQNIEILWKEATGEERRRLLSPLVERVYVDMELKLVGAITPTLAFRALLQCAVQMSRSGVWLVSQDDLERLGVWSCGRWVLPRLHQLQTDPLIVLHALQTHWGAFAVGWAA